MFAESTSPTRTQRVPLVTGATGVVGRNLPAHLGARSDWRYGDFVFSSSHDIGSDMGKAWRTGLREVVDTEAMFLDVFESCRRERIVP